MPTTSMNLKVLLPFRIFTELNGITKIVIETTQGSFGLLPHRMDCVAALTPGILVYERGTEGEVYLAVDEGVMVKTGMDVVVSVRNAIAGTDLESLEETVVREFLDLTVQEKKVRAVLGKMEGSFFVGLTRYDHEQIR